MGSPVSAIVVNLYMEFFEELALESAPSRPRFWKRYVDDTCCIMQKGEVEPLLQHLNDVRLTIPWSWRRMACFPEEGALLKLGYCMTYEKEKGTISSKAV